MTRDEQNRANERIANWLEPMSSLPNEDDSEEMQAYESDAWIATFRLSQETGMHVPSWQPRDFFTDESANALVLEKMPAAELYKHPPDHEASEAGWRCRPDWGLDFAVYHTDRKTAIALAALMLIEQETK